RRRGRWRPGRWRCRGRTRGQEAGRGHPRRGADRPGGLRPAHRRGEERARRPGEGQGRLRAQGEGPHPSRAGGAVVTVIDIAMLAITVVGGASALLVVTARNVVHAALYLVVALLAVAATF